MVQIRTALAQVNPVVGDLGGNCDSVVAYTRRASEAGAHLVVFPEMVVTGYPVEDLALRNGFVAASIKATHGLAERLAAEGMAHLPVIVGFLNRREGPGARFGQPTGAPQNSVALLHHGEIQLVSAKHHLPNYGVFDEFRYFLPGDTLPVVRVHGVDIAFAICEDLWQDGGPVSAVRAAGAAMLITLNGSPYERAKDDVRLELCQRRARETGAAIGYVNMTGGQDELVFEGDSLVVDADGELVARAPQFEEALLVCDLDLPAARSASGEAGATHGFRILRRTASTDPVAPYEPRRPELTPRHNPTNDAGEIYTALVTGVGDFVRKNGFHSVLVGLSGGVDSALTATIAADAIGADQVHGLVMPGPDTSERAVSAAEELVKRQEIGGRTHPIAPLVAAFESVVGREGVAARNLYARLRGDVLTGLAEQERHLVLVTGNKSDLATGQATAHGDVAGGFAPLKDCWRTVVRELARWRNAQAARTGRPEPIPQGCLTEPEPTIPPVPEWPGGTEPPDAELLDALLDAYIGTDKGLVELTAAGFAPEWVRQVIRLVDRAEYQRRQYPPGPKISGRNLSRDRRLPITNRWG